MLPCASIEISLKLVLSALALAARETSMRRRTVNGCAKAFGGVLTPETTAAMTGSVWLRMFDYTRATGVEMITASGPGHELGRGAAWSRLSPQ